MMDTNLNFVDSVNLICIDCVNLMEQCTRMYKNDGYKVTRRDTTPPPYWLLHALPHNTPMPTLRNHLLLCPQNNNYILIHRSFVFLALYITFQFLHNIMKSTWSLCFLTQHNTNHRRHLFCWHFPFSLFPIAQWFVGEYPFSPSQW